MASHLDLVSRMYAWTSHNTARPQRFALRRLSKSGDGADDGRGRAAKTPAIDQARSKNEVNDAEIAQLSRRRRPCDQRTHLCFTSTACVGNAAQDWVRLTRASSGLPSFATAASP